MDVGASTGLPPVGGTPGGSTPGGAGDEAAAIIASLVHDARHLREHGPAPGRAWCRAWSDRVDVAVAALARPSVDGRRLTVAAVGGYGRAELAPASDIDLLLLHDGASAYELEQFVRQIVYPLWDAGLTVGYAVRSRKEAIAAVDDLDTATATLDLRVVAGHGGLAQQVRSEALRRLRRRPSRFIQALRAADDERRAHAGDAAERLEPDLKNGAGGLRDVQSLRWAAGVLIGVTGLDPLIPAGYLGASDRPRLAAAEDRLLEARVALHLHAVDQATTGGRLGAGTKNEVLRLDLHDPVAAGLGYVDRDAHDLAPHGLLRELYLAARTIDHIHRRAWRLIDADMRRGRRRRGRPTEEVVGGFELVDGVLRLPDDEPLDAVDLPVRLIEVLCETGAVLDRASATRLRSAAQRGAVDWGWDDRLRERFLAVLWRGRIALPPLAELDDVGMLTALLPEWEILRGRPQRNPFHRFALDRHAWHTAAELGELVRREPWATARLEEIADRDGLLLGVLLHDVGKALGEPHNRTGIPLARTMAARTGAGAGSVDLVGRLVDLHLLLPDAARRRDVADPALAQELAGIIGDRQTLASLHLLAVADGRATGPTAWSSWTASLVDSLVTKVRAVLEQRHPDEVADGAVRTAEQAQQLATELGSTPEAVREHLAVLPARYAAAVAPRAVVRHTLMVSNPPSATEVRTRVTRSDEVPAEPGEDARGPEPDELDVIARDHPGWFAKVAGVVALNGGSIVAADAFTRQDGLAVDTFKVEPPEGAGGSWWARVEGDLAEAAAGKLAVRARVTRKARAERHRLARLPEVATRLTTEPDPSGRATVVEVHTLDRIGVLYAIATALAELELDIVIARVQTVGHEVVDAFYLRDADGRPLDDHHLQELELAVGAALDELEH